MNYLLKISVLSISLLTIIAGSAISPAMNEISKAFPYENELLIKMILTIPNLVLIPFSLISGKLSHTRSKRKILIYGLVIYFIGGIGGAVGLSIYVLLFFRALLGIGVGLLLPLSAALIADFFSGNERTHMMGLSNSISNLGAIIATTIGGWLASFNWRYVFIVYSLSLIVLAIVFVGLPEPPKRKVGITTKKKFNFKVLKLCLYGILLNIAFYSIIVNISFYLQEQGLGSATLAGGTVPILTLGGFISGLLLKSLSMYFKKRRIPFFLGLMSSGFFLLALAINLFSIFLGVFFIGFSLGVIKPVLLLKATKSAPSDSNSLSIALVSSSFFLGKFLSPFILDYVGLLLGRGDLSFTFLVISISLAISILISLIPQSNNTYPSI